MKDRKVTEYLKNVIKNMPSDWIRLTTHRLDIYDETLAKIQFLEQFENLFKTDNYTFSSLSNLPTAYDYIRLGHPLSSILEWAIAKTHQLPAENIISFSSRTIPVMAILRHNLLEHKDTTIFYQNDLPKGFNAEILQRVYGYQFLLKKVGAIEDIPKSGLNNQGSTIFISNDTDFLHADLPKNVDFIINFHHDLGSILLVNGAQHQHYIEDIQHVRRRETIAMTPANALAALKSFVDEQSNQEKITSRNTALEINKSQVVDLIHQITGSESKTVVASSGLSMQYAIMMGLVDYAQENYVGKDIKFIVPPNCYGGTNDQARRVAACHPQIEIVDLLVDGENDMVESIDVILNQLAHEDAVPYIIAEIPTNPRVEVPNLQKLKEILTKERQIPNGDSAIDPVFILDQTFCPNVHFLGDGEILSEVRTLSYVSGSKFPSGGKCTAGYCVGNTRTNDLMDKIELHLNICDNEATPHQYKILAQQLPSMTQRIQEAYDNTREFVSFIHETLSSAKINFVSEDLARDGFTPSVFSLDLPTKGTTVDERESYKRALNLKLINMMITEIPNESKFCVSYGQLTGSYWTIPATSTQGTTKEGDKDYIVRVSIAPHLDLERHKEVFRKFVRQL